MCGVKGDSFTDFVSQTARLGAFKFIKNMKTRLIITNLKDFFKHGFDKPFKILEQIENQVNRITESENIHFGDKTKVLLANYSSEGFAIFDLESYEFKNDCHLFYYSFNSIAS